MAILVFMKLVDFALIFSVTVVQYSCYQGKHCLETWKCVNLTAVGKITGNQPNAGENVRKLFVVNFVFRATPVRCGLSLDVSVLKPSQGVVSSRSHTCGSWHLSWSWPGQKASASDLGSRASSFYQDVSCRRAMHSFSSIIQTGVP